MEPSPLPSRANAPAASLARAEGWTFDRVYDEHVDFVWRSAVRLGVGDAADDLVQQVFIVVHRQLSSFEGRSSYRTWLFSILLRVANEHRRSLRRKSPHLRHEPADPDALADDTAFTDPHEAMVRAEASRTIDALLDSLDGDKRVVFVMAELEQMSAAEIAEVTGLDPKAVYSRLRAARTDFERAASAMRREQERAAAEAATTRRRQPSVARGGLSPRGSPRKAGER